MENKYRIGMYIRLSLADESTGRGKGESDSVGNQRAIIHRFLDNHDGLSSCPRFEFTDDGYTGTNFLRPKFAELMRRVQAGEINLICVKDFSRFSRDYIEMGNYMECVFPLLGVRFLSVNDGYDSDDYKGTTGGLGVVIRNMIYSAYAKDLSVKTTAAKIQMMKQGKHIGTHPPYGYTMHPTQRNKLSPDPEAAAFVRRIFLEALEGRHTAQIAVGLNRDGIPTPGQYFKYRHPENRKFGNMSEKASWTPQMVYKILTNYVYTGATVAHTRKKASIGTKKVILEQRKNWIIVDGMHEGIVTREEFLTAQAAVTCKTRNLKRASHSYSLKGLVRCGNCKRIMSRRKQADGSFFFTCDHSNWDQNTECAVGERYQETELERTVLGAIRQFFSLAEQRRGRKEQPASVQAHAASLCAAEIEVYRGQIEQLKHARRFWYEKYVEENITKEEYLKWKAGSDETIAALADKIQACAGRLQTLESERFRPDAACREYAGLTCEQAHAFLRAIYVFPDNRVELEWKFQDCFDSL